MPLPVSSNLPQPHVDHDVVWGANQLLWVIDKQIKLVILKRGAVCSAGKHVHIQMAW